MAKLLSKVSSTDTFLEKLMLVDLDEQNQMSLKIYEALTKIKPRFLDQIGVSEKDLKQLSQTLNFTKQYNSMSRISHVENRNLNVSRSLN